MTRTLVFGAGRMAQCVITLAPEHPGIEIVAQVSRKPGGSDGNGRSVPSFTSLNAALQRLEGGVDLLIDFTLPEGTLAAAQWCMAHRVAMLSGVTGIGGEVHAALDKAAESVPVLWAANLSFGINVLAGLLDHLGRAIERDSPITIEEVHHARKKDAPSGTALFLARRLRPPTGGAAGTDPGRIARDFPGIEFVSRREGEVVGDHAVVVRMGDESLTLSHHAGSRRLFARGALEAGQWLAGQPPGRYSAADWICSATKERIPGERA